VKFQRIKSLGARAPTKKILL